MKLNRMMLFSFALIASLGAAEIFGIIMCGNMIPDYKDQIFEESKSDSTRLMFINDEDSSRFYPWLEYDSEKCVSYDVYIKNYYGGLPEASVEDEKNTEEIPEEIIYILCHEADKNGTVFDVNSISDTDLKRAYEYLYSTRKNELNSIISCVNYTFDNNISAPDDTDFISSALINGDDGTLYLNGFEYIGIDKNKHIMDLVMDVTDYRLKFYRLREETDKEFSSSEITKKSAEIINDLDYALTYIEKFYMLSCTEKIDEQYDADVNAENNDEAVQIYLDDADNDNLLLNFLSHIEKSGTHFDIMLSNADKEKYINISFSIDFFDNKYQEDVYMAASFYADIPYYSGEYSIFSIGDEIMIVLSADSRESSTILYYSLSAERITGISIGKI